MSAAPPLRFLALAVGGWVCLRAAILVPGWWEERGRAAVPLAPAPATTLQAPAAPGPAPVATAAERRERRPRPVRRPAPPAPSRGTEFAGAPSTAFVAASQALAAPGRPPARMLRPLPTRPAAAPGLSRWSATGWLLVRGGEGEAGLAPGGLLGGSQAGVRLRYRLNGDPQRPLALTARLSLPRRSAGAEIAAGLEWRPARRLPVALLAERRQRLGREGRSAFALALHGGGAAPLPAGFRLDGYGQAGIVGLRSRDPFADGALRVARPLGRVELGAGAWGAIQPGAERLDVGPALSVRIPAAGADLRLSAQWRFRIAGDAAPASGPALTLGTDF